MLATDLSTLMSVLDQLSTSSHHHHHHSCSSRISC